MRCDWDAAKAEANRRKHGVSFQAASRVFDDPWHQSRRDSFPFEERWQTVGMPSSSEPSVLMVVHTQRMLDGGEDVTRIISARRATPRERRAYEEGEFGSDDA